MDAAQQNTVQNQDLNYASPPQEILYSRPKVSIISLAGKSLVKLFPFFLPFVFCLIGVLFILNYFNFLPLSSLAPGWFSVLPHRYDVGWNKKALLVVSDKLSGKFYSVTGERILIEYKGKVVEFVKGDKLSCNNEEVRKISATEEENLVKPAFCSDLLTSKNYGKIVNLEFSRNSKGLYLVSYIALEKN